MEWKINLEHPSRSDGEAVHRLKSGVVKILSIIVRPKDRETRNILVLKGNALRNENIYINKNPSKKHSD